MADTHWSYGDYTLTPVDGGLRVDWQGRSYVARKWRVTNRLKTFVSACFRGGMVCMFPPTLRPGAACSREYLGFGASGRKRGIVVADQYSKGTTRDRNNLEHVTFMSEYRGFLRHKQVPWEWEFHGGKNLFVPFDRAVAVIQNAGHELVEFAEKLEERRERSRRAKSDEPIVAEKDLQTAVCDLLGSEDVIPGIPHDAICCMHSERQLSAPGQKSAIPDVIVETSEELVILELKKDLAGAPAVAQLQFYMQHPAVLTLTGQRRMRGYLVARELTPEASEMINSTGGAVEFLRVEGTCASDLRLIC